MDASAASSARLCDGFYFPISNATNSAGLSRDADTCSASCGSEARLFYHPNGGGSDVDSMVDLTGLAYSTLPNAFKYRKTLVPECRCRPHPWSDAELQRHRAYAEGRPAAADAGSPASPPARESGILPSDASGIVERPEPIAREPASQPWLPAASGSGRPSRSRYIWPLRRHDQLLALPVFMAGRARAHWGTRVVQKHAYPRPASANRRARRFT